MKTLREDLREKSVVVSNYSQDMMSFKNPNTYPTLLSEKEEEKLIKDMGFDLIIDKLKRNKNQNNYLLKYGSLIKTQDILDVAEKYGLFFFETKYYIGEIGENTLELSSKFLKEADNREEVAFYVLAPSEKFKLDKIQEETSKEIAKLDPSLFAYIGEDFWLMIDSWGDDFTEERAKEHTKMINSQDELSPLFSALLVCLLPPLIVLSLQNNGEFLFRYPFLSLVKWGAYFSLLIYTIIKNNTKSKYSFKFLNYYKNKSLMLYRLDKDKRLKKRKR